MWKRELARHPDKELADYVCTGIKDGLRIGFNYRKCVCVSALRNMKSVTEHREEVKYIHGERKAGRLLGPLRRADFLDVQVSAFGVIPKSEPGKWRLIVDLSAS